MNRGFSTSSPNASRSLFMAVLTLCSKSTKVSVGQRLWRISSRVTTSPGRRRSAAKIWKGLCWSLILSPLRRTSPHRRSTSNSPTRRRAIAVAGTCMAGQPALRFRPYPCPKQVSTGNRPGTGLIMRRFFCLFTNGLPRVYTPCMAFSGRLPEDSSK